MSIINILFVYTYTVIKIVQQQRGKVRGFKKCRSTIDQIQSMRQTDRQTFWRRPQDVPFVRRLQGCL